MSTDAQPTTGESNDQRPTSRRCDRCGHYGGLETHGVETEADVLCMVCAKEVGADD